MSTCTTSYSQMKSYMLIADNKVNVVDCTLKVAKKKGCSQIKILIRLIYADTRIQ